MVIVAAWVLIALGIAHIAYGAIRFKSPLKEAFAKGFIGGFTGSDSRRLAFWFTLAGPLLAMTGHIILRAMNAGDVELVRLIGYYLLPIFALGVLAFPKSPLWSVLFLAPIFIFAS